MNEAGQWKIIVYRKAEKILKKLDGDNLKRLRSAITELGVNPRPMGYKKMTGHENLYRMRVGDWRIIYALEDDKLIVLVLEISTRGEAYREF